MKIEEELNTSKQMPDSRRVILNLLVTSQWITVTMAEVLKDYDISSPQFNVLRILRGQKAKPANLNTIQEKMVSKMSNTTRLVDKLIAKKLVNRVICEKNRRKVEITITEKGLKLLETLDPEIDRVENHITENLEKEEKITLAELLKKIRK